MSSFTNPEYNHYFENYPYELSDFQKHAIKAIVDGNHVLVTAHTGSGKTLPAEFAIRHFVKQGKKVIYTSPIKALSNQKYYEFSRKFPDITFGLLTGDIKTNPSADVLIMTTEILMNKLFRMHDVAAATSSRLSFEMDIERDLASVVFDECHYINDADRGHVWEQCILMLPTQVQMVLLSATIDNPSGFARWITESKTASKTICVDDKQIGKQVIICSTNHRVVPLTHYMFVTTPEGLHKKINDKTVSAGLRKTFNTCLTIQDSEGAFNAQNYSEVGGILRLMDKHGISTTRKHVLNTLIEHMKGGGRTEGSSMLPAIVFVFSRKLVEQCAEEVTVPLFTADSVDTVDTIDIPYHKIRHECMTIIRRLPNWKEYAELPEYMRLVNLLEKGIGIHHSGMLPVLKEIVELMISKKYIRVLFATESFAIGLDCPIKSAVFISLKKFASSSGTSGSRYLLSHEYTQMAGRAGRRGIDTIGNVIHCVNLFEHATLPTQITYSEILGGKPQRLVSKFKIDYKMIMNLLVSTVSSTPSSLEEVKVPLSFDLINKSMMSSEMASMERGAKHDIAEYEKRISDLQQQFLGTPIEILQEYCKMQEIRTMASNKKLKEIDAACSALLKAHANMVADLRVYKELTACETELASKRGEYISMTNYSQTCVKTVLNVLADRGIIENSGIHSEKGVICSSIAEVNPLLMTSLFEEYKDFAEFSPEMLAGFLTLFTDVRIPSGKEDGIQVDTYFLDKAFSQFARVCDDLADCEHAHGIKEPVNTDQHLDASLIADDVIDWCRSQTEDDCKLVLHHLLLYKGVSVGDFTKALLKISTVVRELISVCEKTGKVELMSRLSQIDPLILKHVTTNQSLYL
jgi:superfamily II RNA helicase